MSYRGRFAPTPSGPLHMGSLLTALASFVQARCAGGQWLVRIDDLDTPRCVPGADVEILKQLEVHGLQWDETPRYQSDHQSEYEAALEKLQRKGLLYACVCTRATLAAESSFGPDGPVYRGSCRGLAIQTTDHALRLNIQEGVEEFVDGLQGHQSRQLQSEVGDFTIRRSDGQIGYQLACAIDETAMGIAEVVRGIDLLGSSFRQRIVQKNLGLEHPSYMHLPLLLDATGRKLSKQNHAPSISATSASDNLWFCLDYLQQGPPAELKGAAPSELLNWAVNHWKIENIPK